LDAWLQIRQIRQMERTLQVQRDGGNRIWTVGHRSRNGEKVSFFEQKADFIRHRS